MAKIFFDGNFVDEKEAVVPVTIHALQYGTGCFEGLRAYYNKEENTLNVFRLEDHFKRLKNSCKVLHINLPYSVEEMSQFTVDLLKKNFQKTDIYIRPFAFKNDSGLSLDLTKLKDSMVIFSMPLGMYLDTNNGIKVNVSSWRRVSDNSLPPKAKIAGSYVNATLAKTESALAGFDEALFLDQSDHIIEGTSENIFIIRENKVFTPPVSDDILVGLTRDSVIKLIEKELGMKVFERSISRSEIYSCDEIFLVGTAAEVTPVIEVDRREVGQGKIGEVTAKLKDIYFKLVHGQLKGYDNWITKVSGI